MNASYTRDQLRRAYAHAWNRREAGAPLTPLDAMIVGVIELHPEYQGLVADQDTALSFESSAGGTNPFLHMGLHLAVREQLSIDRPPGIRELHRHLSARRDAHAADHLLMDALEQTLAEGQRLGTPPDEAAYLHRVRTRVADAYHAAGGRQRIK